MKMKLFLLLMFGGLCRADLLNRGYLPPPGAKTSGGSDGAVDLPLETPFETTGSGPQRKPIQGSFPVQYRPEDHNVYRTHSSVSNQEDNFTAGTQQPESVNIPTTTTSFAFTQTTTFSPLKDDCKTQQCTSSQYTISSFPISQEQTGTVQQIPFGQQPQANVRGAVPEFQSTGLGLTTQVPFSPPAYGSTSHPNQGVSQTFTTLGGNKSPATFNNGYLPEGTAPSTKFPVEQKNYGYNRPGVSTPPQFHQDEALSITSASTIAPLIQFSKPGFGSPSQYSPIAAAGNIPINGGLPRSQSVFSSTSLSQYPYKETFITSLKNSSELPNGPINGNAAVISETSSLILPTGKTNQFPSVSLPGDSNVVGIGALPSIDSSPYNQAIFGRPGISSLFPNVPQSGITSSIPGVTAGVLQTPGSSELASVLSDVTPSDITGSLFSSTLTPQYPNQPKFGQRPEISSGFSKVLPTVSAMIPGSVLIPSDFSSGAGGASSLIPNFPSQTGQAQPYYRPKATLDTNATILKYDNIITPEGYFSYSFDTSNGIHADETGDASDGVKAEGSFSYTGDDGQFYSVTYTADENGYQPKGYHLPTPPPIPEAIQRVIEKSERDKAAGIIPDEGFYDDEKYGYKKYQKKPGQGTFFPTQTSSEAEVNNVPNRRPIVPGRGPFNSGISHNLPSLPYDRTQEDETFSQTTLRPNYESKYAPSVQGADRKTAIHKPPKYLPEPSSSQYPQSTSFDYKPQGITSESDEIRGGMKTEYIPRQSTSLIGNSDQTGLRVPGDQSFPIKKIQNVSGSPITTSPNILEGTRRRDPTQNIKPYGENYNQFGQVITNTLPKHNVPGSTITRPASPRPYESPLDKLNISVTSESTIPDRKDQFIQMHEPPGIGANLQFDQIKYSNVQQIQETQTPSSYDYTVPVKVQYEDGVYREKPKTKPETPTIRPSTYSSNGQTRVTSAPEIIRGDGYATKPTYEKQNEFYQTIGNNVNRPSTPSEGQFYAENLAPGKTGSTFIPSSNTDFPQKEQTSAITRPYGHTTMKPTGYKYNVPSQRFDYGITQRPQTGKISSFAQRPTMELPSENVESASSIAPEIFSASEDVYPSSPEVDGTDFTARTVKKPGRPSPGSIELFNVTPDTLDSTVIGTDFVTGRPFDGTISTSKPVTTSRGSTRYKTVPSRIETSTAVPGQPRYGESTPVTNTQERLTTVESRPKGSPPSQYPSQQTTTALPSGFESIQSQFITSKPEYNKKFAYSQKAQEPISPFGKPQDQPAKRPSVSENMFIQQEEGIYGPAPTISGSSVFVQAQPSTPKPFQVPQGAPQRAYPGSQFQPSTSILEGDLSKEYSQGSQYPSTIRPFGSKFSSQSRVSGYPTSQQTSYTVTGPVQYNISRPDNTGQQSTQATAIDGQTYPEQDHEINGRTMDTESKQQGFAVEPTREFSVQPKQDHFRPGQQMPGQFEQQKSNQFLLEQPRPGQSAQRELGQFESHQQKPSQFEQRKPGRGESDLKPDDYKQRISDQFGKEKEGPEPFALVQQRPGILLSEEQKPLQFGSELQHTGQSEQRKPSQFETNQGRPGQKQVQFGFDQQRPGQFGLNQQEPGQSVTYQRKPGSFEVNQQRPGQYILEQQKPGQFDSNQQVGQQRPKGKGSQQTGQFGTEQRPSQFGTNDSSFPKVKGEVFSPSRKPPSYDPETGYHY